MDTLFSIKDKVVLVTGSARGIGYTLAEAMGRAGAKIVINDINREAIEKAMKALAAQGIRVCGSLFDVTDPEQVASEVAVIEKYFGPIEVLVNNAGIQIRHKAEEFPIEDYDKILAVNLKGVFVVSQAVARGGMIARQRGKIINICSMQSELGRQSITPYAASKGGVRMLTRGLATEWGKHNIQVNGIGPGYFITEMTRPLVEDKEFNAWLCSRTPANRWGDPKELVGSAIFLASEASDYVNGHILYVDGGMLACV